MHPVLLTLIALFALLGHGYFWVAIVNRLHAWAGPRVLIDGSSLISAIAFVVLPFVVGWEWIQHGSEFFNAGELDPFAHATMIYVLLCAFFGFGKLLAKLVGEARQDDAKTLIAKEQRFVASAANLPSDELHGAYTKLLCRIPGNQVLELAIDTKRLFIPRLPKALESLRVVHISDFHIMGRIGPVWFAKVAQAVNSLSPDVVFVTGDLVEVENCRSWLIDSMKSMRAKYGVYFVLGNHDFYIDSEQTIRDLEAIGWTHLGGKAVVAKWNNWPVLLTGSEVPWQRKLADVSSVERDIDARPFRFALMHSPDQFDWACGMDADLAVAGHNHGGQICLPILGAVAAPSLYGTRFAVGTFRRGLNVLHVTRGISGETPFRWGCPPEIALLELVRTAK